MHGQHIVDGHADVVAAQTLIALQQQTGSDQQNHGEADLDDQQRSAKRRRVAAPLCARDDSCNACQNACMYGTRRPRSIPRTERTHRDRAQCEADHHAVNVDGPDAIHIRRASAPATAPRRTANRRPKAPPAADSSRLSMIRSRTRRILPPPSADRMACFLARVQPCEPPAGRRHSCRRSAARIPLPRTWRTEVSCRSPRRRRASSAPAPSHGSRAGRARSRSASGEPSILLTRPGRVVPESSRAATRNS